MSPTSDLLTMSSSSYSDAFKFPKLNGLNYSSWADHIQSALQAQMLWLIVSGIETVPPKAEESSMSPSEFWLMRKEWLEWMQQGQVAQGSIKGAYKDSQLPYVVDCKSSQEMWARLKKVHQENQSKINIITLRISILRSMLKVPQWLTILLPCLTSNIALNRPVKPFPIFMLLVQ